MTDDSQIPNPDSQPAEPTVLDLFKSVTRDWKSFFEFLTSVFSNERRAAIERAAMDEAWVIAEAREMEAAPESEAQHAGPTAVTGFPWRSVLGLFLALYAQNSLEPPNPKVSLAVALYVFAAGLIVWAFIRSEWNLQLYPAHNTVRADPLTIRPLPLILSMVFAAIAFWDFGGNLFTLTNVTLWLIAIVLFVYAVWLRGSKRDAAPAAQSRRKPRIWLLILLAIAGVLIFFRVYRIGGVPAEPFSDHAEKILDVYDVSQGQTHIFFPRNTGREAIQMYWTLLMSWIFGTGLSFLTLKIGTVLLGLFTIPYIYLLGKELGSERVGVFAALLFGIGYWPNVIARIGLRFPLYPLFVAPTLLYLIRGLRTRSRNDFILSGLFLGLGLHGYSPFRIVPLVVVAAFIIYWLHSASKGWRQQAVWWLMVVGFTSLVIFLPLMRYALENPDMFSFRAMTRLTGEEQALPGPIGQIFLSNVWNGLKMFNYDDGNIWVNSLPHRPALDIVTGALFLLGILLLIARYVRKRDWRDLFLLVSIPLLQLPSTLSLAFPDENPALNRAAGASVAVFIIVALALDGLVTTLGSGSRRKFWAWGLSGILLVVSGLQNYDLVFNQFDQNYRDGAWNSSEMGKVISDFRAKYGETDTVWIVPYPYWVDTRLPGVWAGIPNRDFAVFRDNLKSTVDARYPKLFMFWHEDVDTQNALMQLYPNGVLSRYTSAVFGKDFMVYLVER